MRYTPADKNRKALASPEVLGALPTARKLALEAGRRVVKLLDEPIVSERKADKSVVTNADHAANRIIVDGLRAAYPSHAILSEESGFSGSPDAEMVWLIDPLDGTKAYARRAPGFAVQIGLLERGRPALGIVYDPLADHLYEAAAGMGAFLTHAGRTERVRVSGRSEWRDVLAVTSTGFPEKDRAAFESLGIRFIEPVNSVGVKIGRLVRQEADVYANHHPVHVWDTLGPLVVLEEAGGVMTQIDGSPLEFSLDPSGSDPYRHALATLASNGTRHDDVLAFWNDARKMC